MGGGTMRSRVRGSRIERQVGRCGACGGRVDGRRLRKEGVRDGQRRLAISSRSLALTILRHAQEDIRRILHNDPLCEPSMTLQCPTVYSPTPRMIIIVVLSTHIDPLTSCSLKIKDADLRISRSRYDATVARPGGEGYVEDVAAMAGVDAGGEAEVECGKGVGGIVVAFVFIGAAAVERGWRADVRSTFGDGGT